MQTQVPHNTSQRQGAAKKEGSLSKHICSSHNRSRIMWAKDSVNVPPFAKQEFSSHNQSHTPKVRHNTIPQRRKRGKRNHWHKNVFDVYVAAKATSKPMWNKSKFLFNQRQIPISIKMFWEMTLVWTLQHFLEIYSSIKNFW